MGRPRLNYALVEIPFVMSNPDYLGLAPKEKLVYLTVWFKAVFDRKEWHENNGILHRFLALNTGLEIKEISTILGHLKSNPAFFLQKGNWFRVKGVKNLHRKMDWFPANNMQVNEKGLEWNGREGSKGEEKSAPKPPSFSTEFLEKWNTFAAKNGLSEARSISPGRHKALKARMADPNWATDLDKALLAATDCAFLKGKNDRGWKMDIDFILRPDSVNKILEGKYISSGKDTLYDDGTEDIPTDIDFNKPVGGV